MVWNHFFHRRLGPEGCKLAGWLRVGFALLFVVDRLLLTVDIDEYFSPSHGKVPLWLGREKVPENAHTIFQISPESDSLIWIVHWIGVLQGILLILGIQPRLQMLGVFFNLVSFQHHNQLIWDGEDMMMKAFCTNFLFMPLHRCTIYDGFGSKRDLDNKKSNDWWPMWPIRLFQIHLCSIYLGASIGKVKGGGWTNGLALYYVGYAQDIYPGAWNPDVIFNRLGPLMFLTYSSLFLELSSWSMVWVPSLRMPIVFGMISLHIGIEFFMNMHIFEWLSIDGWLTFLLQPDPSQGAEGSTVKRFIGNVFIAFFLVAYFVCETPVWHMGYIVPEALNPSIDKLLAFQERLNEKVFPLLALTGVHTYTFDMFNGDTCNGWNRYYLRAEIDLSNGTRVDWNSPKWGEQGIIERKRNMRPIDYWENVQEGEVRSEQLHLSKLLASNYEDNFRELTLYQIFSEALPPKEGIGWFEPARVPMIVREFELLTLSVCADHRSDCFDIVYEDEDCDDELAKDCPLTCEICEDYKWYYNDDAWGFQDEGEKEEWVEEESYDDDDGARGVDEF